MGFSLKKIAKAVASPFTTFASGTGSFLNDVTGVNSQLDKTYKQQIDAMNRQNAFDVKMWNMQNEYNTPAAQIARMAQAGININPTSYALGTGNLSNTAGMVSSDSGFSGSGSPAGNPVSMAIGVANSIAGIKNTMAQTANMQKQNENLDGVIQSTQLENQIRQHNLQYAQDHNTPVGMMPGMDATGASFVNRFTSGLVSMWKGIKNWFN